MVAALVSRVAGRLVNLGLLVWLARSLSVADFAIYNYLFVLAATAALVVDSGATSIVGRDVARGELDVAGAYRLALPIQLMTGCIALIAVLSIVLVAPGPGASMYAATGAGIFIALNGVFDLQCALWRSSGWPWREAALQTVSAVAQVVLVAWVVSAGWSLSVLFGVVSLKQLLLVMALGIGFRRKRKSASRTQVPRKSLILWGLRLSIATTCLALILRLGHMVVSNAATTQEIADYAAATRFLELAVTLSYSVGIGILPALARHAKAGTLVNRLAPARLLIGSLVLSYLLVAPFAYFSSALTQVIFGARYATAAGEVRLFLLSSPLVLILYLSWFLLLASRSEKQIPLALGIGAFLVVVLSPIILWAETAGSAAVVTLVALSVPALVLSVSASRATLQPSV